MLTLFRRCCLLMMLLLPVSAFAANSPQQVVQGTVDALLSDLDANKERYKQDPEAFYNSLNEILGPVVDGDGISRSIMTVKYSRNATPEQMARFEENFKRSLMQFYGNALLEYDNQNIRMLPAREERDGRSSVGMEVTGRNGAVYPVSYTMVERDGRWLVRNVIINGINIGKLFRDQFADTMARNGNDLDKTIAEWGSVVAKAKDSQAGQQATGNE
ncbi:MlaC/ttg2D family ABC transporter substrate-binding protein [Pseudomonas matsuisoli]|uniref:Toluene tolerance protein n=1 Tax=Pseudomonas matsuisoli TaxID=1515666 RepID=A0A917V199_9PSED|nr:ABC transporter substrate-binding protein [Pseudomonas matsuisoli]GGK07903.1 hypothetical protein GCM10009304_37560 [Pseudomonas matsuisoli]